MVVALALAAVGAIFARSAPAEAAGLSISNLSPDRYFSPNGDGQEDTAYVGYTLSESAAVTITIRNGQGNLVRTLQNNISEPQGSDSFSWDGHQENGSSAPNGAYIYTIEASGPSGHASASGRIGIDRNVPGAISSPTPGQTISGNFQLVFAPTAGEDVTGVTFYGRSCQDSYYYDCVVSSLAPEPDGTFAASIEAEELRAGENEIYAYVEYTDAFGETHLYSTPPVPVTVAYPEQISDVSPDRYFSPNGDGQEDTADVGYSLTTPASVTVVIKNASGQLVKTVLSEAEQGPYNSGFLWDGTDEASEPAPEGVYTYTITAVGSYGAPAVASGRIGIDRKLPGAITTPKAGATLTGDSQLVFAPTAGEDVTGVTFYGRSCQDSYYYDCVVSSLAPEPDGTFAASIEAEELRAGENEIYAYVEYTDAFGETHLYSTPPVPVTVAYPEQISDVSPDRYFSPNGDGQEDTADVGYSLTTPASVTVVIKNASGQLVKTVLSEAEQGPYNSGFLWDGTDEASEPAPEGVYTYTITAVGSYGAPAVASGRIGIDRKLPGAITTPKAGATLTGDSQLVFAPTAGEDVTGVTFYGRSCQDSYYYDCVVSSLAPEPDGTFAASIEAEELRAGENEIYAYVEYTDAFGETHLYSTPPVPVTVAYPEQISDVSPDRYFSPNGDGQEDTADVGYSLTTPASVTVVIKNASGQLVKTVLSEAEQGPYNSGFLWDGTDEASEPAPEGVYTYTITAVGSYGAPAVASGRIGIDRKLPGAITTPKAGATLTGDSQLVFAPTAGEDVTGVTFYGRSCQDSYYYDCVVSSLAPEPDGTFAASIEAEELRAGENEIYAYVEYTDAFGETHSYSTPPVPVRVVYAILELSAEASPISGPAPLATKFKIKASDSVSSTLDYEIDFGDGSAEEEGALSGAGTATIKHTYTTAGVDDASVTVFDPYGNYRQQSLELTVEASEKSVPVNVLAPTISGLAREGETLTESHGSWTGSPTSYTYQWLRCNQQGGACLPIPHATSQTYTLVQEDVSHTIEVRETAKNSHGAGAPATSSHTAVVVSEPPVNVNPPTISGLTLIGHTLVESHGSWTHEPTSYAYHWLRCKGSNCQPIENATGSAYLLGSADVGNTIEVQEIASNAGGSSAPATSAATSIITATPLRASAGEDIAATQGTPVTLDGSGSSPAESIISYHWEFGDGSSGSGAIVNHTYRKAGTYTATLTVSDGHTEASSSTTVTVTAPSGPQLEVSTLDANEQPLEGVEVLYMSPSGQKTSAISNAAGKASLSGLPDGTSTVYAYKEGFQPAAAEASILEGSGQAAITLTPGEVATSTLKDKEMNLQEIEAAGIDTSDPANQQVYEFEVRLAFFPSPVELHCDVNSDGEFVGECEISSEEEVREGEHGHGGPEGGECSSESCGIEVEGGGEVLVVPKIVEGKPLIEWLILRGKVTILKQFTTATLTIQNLAPEPFKLVKGNATLVLPPGLSLAPTATPQSFSQPIPDIPGSGSASATWVVRGDEPGDYSFSADYAGSLEPFEAPVDITATLAEPWRVWGSEAMTLSVKADSGKLRPGVPYHVTIGVTNKADIPLYNVNLEIDSKVHANFIFQPDERFSDTVGELEPGETLYSHRYVLLPDAESVGVFNPSLSSATFVGEEIHPGENIEAVTPPPLYAISGPHDTANMIHLRWETVPGAEGYEVFSTPNLDTPFAEAPDRAATSPGGALSTTPLPASATDAYLAPTEGATRYYAVSALVAGHPTLESEAIPDSAGEKATVRELPEFGRCLSAPKIAEGGKTVYRGAYTDSKCTKPNTTTTGKYEWLPGPGVANGFTAAQGAATLETVGKTIVKCSGGSLGGEIASRKTASATLTLTGCAIGSSQTECHSNGAAAGEIRSASLEGRLGYIAKAAKPSIGLDLLSTSGPLAELVCGGERTTITGSVIAPLTGVNKMASKLVLKLKAGKGKQVPEHFEGASQDTLDWEEAGKTEEQVGLTATESLKLGESIEIGA